ncbi:PREDICTED: E3 ubiquitin-protein ligase SINA-like 7 [Camelina sativa]|uniref:RING-type E3 ubiquitin transferase n=1 Tax=Camelina sativa TaxID=90675 RepID=A0ABM0USK1_CAMSA|nr:PREDICTED: E3 ubiquitin-protein ligase SINA-like 7 [Camelina sativa]
MECSSSDVNGMSNINLRKRQRTEDKTRSSMLDLDFLDCPICVEPFTIPIFQCDNGHFTCASCFPKLSNKCPSCALPVGHSRCRAMEKVLESIFVPCPNANLGCTKHVSYGKEATHEKECTFSQICSCPLEDCSHICSYDNMFRHFTRDHQNRYMLFCCDNFFNVRMNINDKILIEIEYMINLSFAVQCFREPYGVYVTVSCIAPSTPEVGEFTYLLIYTVDGNTMTYESSEVKRILEVSSQRPEESFMLIPKRFLRGDSLKMKLCINKLKQ